jgi:DNA polymerase
MRTLAIDIETFSPTDLSKAGVYRYAEDPGFEILLFAYAFNGDPVKCIDLKGSTITGLFPASRTTKENRLPQEIVDALYDPTIVKTAYNATFERVCLNAHLAKRNLAGLPIAQWECTMVKAAMAGLPMGLDLVAKALNLEEGKMKEGAALIRYFSLPVRPTRANNMRTRNLPEDAPEKWETFVRYCIRDVEVEREIRNALENFKIPDEEKTQYVLDQRINDRGVGIDAVMVKNAIHIYNAYAEKLTAEAAALTGLDNPNSVAKLKAWLEDETGKVVNTLSKSSVSEMLGKDNFGSETTDRVLEIRQKLAKSSVKKYEAMLTAGNRARGLFQFYGASRTGRWSGRNIQLQNLPQNHLEDLDLARRLVKDGDGEMLELLYDNVPDILSQLVRTAIIPTEGHTFLVADFSAIEARVTAWLAREQWRLDVFRGDGKIYEASAAQMFKVPVENVTKGSSLRQKGKIAELALGYGGGVVALESMGALKMGLRRDELQPLVDKWRGANEDIAKLWREVGAGAFYAVKERRPKVLFSGVYIQLKDGNLLIKLPSERQLVYRNARIGENKYGREAVEYRGANQVTRRWEWQQSYGPKLVENIVQAIARDVLAEAMHRLEGMNYRIVMHVHDEVVIEADPKRKDLNEQLKEVCDIMAETPQWAEDLPLRADGYITEYYKKD